LNPYDLCSKNKSLIVNILYKHVISTQEESSLWRVENADASVLSIANHNNTQYIRLFELILPIVRMTTLCNWLSVACHLHSCVLGTKKPKL